MQQAAIFYTIYEYECIPLPFKIPCFSLNFLGFYLLNSSGQILIDVRIGSVNERF